MASALSTPAVPQRPAGVERRHIGPIHDQLPAWTFSTPALTERGYFTRKQALSYGETDQSLQAALRSGALVRLRFGVYAPAGGLDGLDDDGRHLLLAQASWRSNAAGCALAGPTAALWHGYDVFGHDLRHGPPRSTRSWLGSSRERASCTTGSGRRHARRPSAQRGPGRQSRGRRLAGGPPVGPRGRRGHGRLRPAPVAGPGRPAGAGRGALARPAALAYRSTRPSAGATRGESPGESLTRMACSATDPGADAAAPGRRPRRPFRRAARTSTGRSSGSWASSTVGSSTDGCCRRGRRRSTRWSGRRTGEDEMRATSRGMSRFVWPERAARLLRRRMARLQHELEQSRRLYVASREVRRGLTAASRPAHHGNSLLTTADLPWSAPEFHVNVKHQVGWGDATESLVPRNPALSADGVRRGRWGRRRGPSRRC